LVSGPDLEDWRNQTFPDRERPTGELLDRLPSPASKEERERLAKLRNPTLLRTQNELRKVVNNLIGMFGKPDRIRIELARDVGNSKREREKMQSDNRKRETKRKEAVKDLQAKGIAEPSRDDIEKWLLWKESGERCPYTGDQIGFDALFHTNHFDVEHIWPRSRSLDNSFRNKTLCRKEINIAKSNRTPFEYLGHDLDRWAAIQTRLQGMIATKGGFGMSPGKVRRFLAPSMPDDFASRQLNDTGYAARQALALLKRLWPDLGAQAPVTVQAVSGRVTAQLRKLWTLNNILSDDGEKNLAPTIATTRWTR
jgi:CRISPR-associated endonuclease Csn1